MSVTAMLQQLRRLAHVRVAPGQTKNLYSDGSAPGSGWKLRTRIEWLPNPFCALCFWWPERDGINAGM